MVPSPITSDSYKCAISSHPFRTPPSIHLYTHPPTHPGLHSFSKVNFKLLLNARHCAFLHLCCLEILLKFCFLWEAYRNWSISKWSLLNLDKSNKYLTQHRPTSFSVMFLHLCPVRRPLPNIERSLVQGAGLTLTYNTYASHSTFNVCAYHFTKNTVVFPQQQALKYRPKNKPRAQVKKYRIKKSGMFLSLGSLGISLWGKD